MVPYSIILCALPGFSLQQVGPFRFNKNEIYADIESSSTVNLSDVRLFILCAFSQNLDIADSQVSG
jgi:hypothetical protein